MERDNWIFSTSQLDEINSVRAKTFPKGYTELDEKKLLNYYVLLSKELLKILDIEEDKMQILCFSVQLFKRLCLRNSIFLLPNLDQMCLNCMYLGLKLHERTDQNIFCIVEKLKLKPKHKSKIHFGDEGYAQQELGLVELLNFEIQIPQFYQTISSTNHLLKLHIQLESFLFNSYLAEVRKYFTRALFNDTIFQYKHGYIAVAICECALFSICSQFSPSNLHTNTVIGPSNRPVSNQVQQKIKNIFQNYQREEQTSLLLFQFIDNQTPKDFKENILSRLPNILQVAQVLKTTKDFDPPQGIDVLKLFGQVFKLSNQKDDFKRPDFKIKRQDSINSLKQGEYEAPLNQENYDIEPRKLIKY